MMKKSIMLMFAMVMMSSTFLSAQVKKVNLEQTPGAFTTESLTLAAGEYQFIIANKDVGHDVGFVLTPQGKYTPENHLKAAYVTAPVPTGKTSMTNVVDLAPGSYEYFCPLNPTEKYPLTVIGNVGKISLGQTPGVFEVQSLTVVEGTYQFEINNNGVEQNVGFVLVPKGKYDPANHITAAYVSATVPNGESSNTGIVQLEAGEYEYFCPLNKTPKYSLTVK